MSALLPVSKEVFADWRGKGHAPFPDDVRRGCLGLVPSLRIFNSERFYRVSRTVVAYIGVQLNTGRVGGNASRRGFQLQVGRPAFNPLGFVGLAQVTDWIEYG